MHELIFLDVETTGFDPKKDKIIEIGCVKWRDGKVIDTYESFSNPHKSIPREVVMLTGIQQSQVDEAPDFDTLVPTINEFIKGCAIVGHNIQFDAGFLRSHGITIDGPELDTVDLAHILLPKEASYALEVLMKKYELTLRDSHRALIDTLTTVEFFNFMLSKIKELPPDIKKELRSFLNKTQWPARVVFDMEEYAPSNAEKIAPNGEKNGIQEIRSEKTWGTELCSFITENPHTVIESPYAPAFESFKATPSIWSYSLRGNRDKIIAAAQKYNVSVEQYKSPQAYLSLTKLKSALEEQRRGQETIRVPFLAKMIVWSGITETGDREEVSLRREEHSYFEEIADTQGTDSYYLKALEKAKKSTWIIAHHGSIWPHNPGMESLLSERHLFVGDVHALEDSLTYFCQDRFTQNDFISQWGEQGTMLAGFLGIFFEKQKSYTNAAESDSIIIDDNALSTLEWKRFTEAASNLPDSEKKETLLKALNINVQEDITYLSFFADELSYTKTPLYLGGIFSECVAAAKAVTLFDCSASGDGSFSLVKELFELDSSWQTHKEVASPLELHERQLLVTIPNDFPEPNSNGYFKECLTLFGALLEQYKGKCLFIVNSKQAAYTFHTALASKAQALGVRLLSYGQSGGVGKMIAQFQENPQSTALIATTSLLPRIEEVLELSNVIVLNKVPFDPPFNPITKARSEQFDDGFREYSVQRALMRFRAMMSMLGHAKANAGKQKSLCVLDSRLHTKGYGKLFIKAMEQ